MEICWINGHAAVPGNEIADENAKEATRRQEEMIVFPYQDFLPIIMTSYMKNGTQSGMRKITNLKNSNQTPGH